MKELNKEELLASLDANEQFKSALAAMNDEKMRVYARSLAESVISNLYDVLTPVLADPTVIEALNLQPSGSAEPFVKM